MSHFDQAIAVLEMAGDQALLTAKWLQESLGVLVPEPTWGQGAPSALDGRMPGKRRDPDPAAPTDITGRRSKRWPRRRSR